MDFIPIIVTLVPLLTVLAVGLMGSTRRLGFWLSVVLAVVLTPIGGGLVAVLSGPKRLKRRAARRAADSPRAA